ncbi:MAG TPA: VWA domain-containing protein [Longimicrobiales bacterium]|nr:VWA domain-containing protein [Longimicrobiales bacterium]
MSFGSFEFEQPLFLLLIVPLVAAAFWLSRRPPRAIVFSRASLVRRLQRRGTNILARVPGWLRFAALASVIVALAAPRTGVSAVDVEADGIAIVLAVDISSSMLAEDFRPRNRMAVARETAAEFVRGREFDRIGLVGFAGEALTLAPLSIDYPVVYRAIEMLDIGLLQDGTAIGTAIATAANRLRDAPGESRVMILLTDGVNNRGQIDPLTAARAAEAFGIRIYTIGVGSEGTVPIPIGRGALGGVQYANVPVDIDEELLQEIADLTGGLYFRATTEAALDSIYRRIDELEKTTVEVRQYMEYTPRYMPFLVLAGVLLLGEWLLRASRWGVVP